MIKNTKSYIVDTDLVLDAILNRSDEDLCSSGFWRGAEKSQSNVYLTSTGLEKIISLIKVLVVVDEHVDEVIEEIKSRFKIYEISRDVIMKARKINLKDFESAIEIICSKHIQGIITNRSEDFESIDLESREIINCLEPSSILEINEINNKENELKKIFEKSLKNPNSRDLNSQCEEHLSFYMNIAEKNGGEDIGFYFTTYDVLEKHWGEFQLVLDYGYKRAESNIEYYHKFKKTWSYLNRFSDLYSHSDERIYWSEKIMELSYRYEQWEDYFKAAVSKAWTLTMRGDIVKAKKEMAKAKEKKDFVNNCLHMLSFYHCYFVIYVHSNEFDLAVKSLDKQRMMLENLKQSSLNLHDIGRAEVNLRRNLARLNYGRGLFQIKNIKDNKEKLYEGIKLLEESITDFEICLDLSKDTNWQRGMGYSHNRIADAQIELSKYCDKQKKVELLKNAKEHIEAGLPIAVTNKNRRRLGEYYLSLSNLYLQQGKKDQSNERREKGVEILENINERHSQHLVVA
jgi:tetratricopeptide (TPR) repeat protein